MPYARSSGDVAHKNLQYLNHLNGVINEALRLHPPIPTSLPRLTPPDGLDIGGTYVPGNVTVWCPQYAIGRSKFRIVSLTEWMFISTFGIAD